MPETALAKRLPGLPSILLETRGGPRFGIAYPGANAILYTHEPAQ